MLVTNTSPANLSSVIGATHLRIIGNTIYALKIRFTMDWNATVSKKDEIAYSVEQDSADSVTADSLTAGATPIQIVASGPDRPTQQIKLVHQVNHQCHQICLDSKPLFGAR